MFKGIISLFTSGIIFNPFVFSGIVAGCFCYFNMEPVDIRNLFLKKELYTLVTFLAGVFVFCFSKRYDESGRHLDLWSMSLLIVTNVIKFFMSFVLVMSFISMINIF